MFVFMGQIGLGLAFGMFNSILEQTVGLRIPYQEDKFKLFSSWLHTKTIVIQV